MSQGRKAWYRKATPPVTPAPKCLHAISPGPGLGNMPSPHSRHWVKGKKK
ncbi:hypothetical protein TorRG33x02_275530 [Trema orientale]|uniref:Uncharacterized protein n=1 Tax=Trema orientale TaxID=63057 RepID=A0A2P5CRN4_TREOI|nr:hypothetical protein TorRG33x02_275530 [Trema orientale]